MLPPLRCLYLPHSPEQHANAPQADVLGIMHFTSASSGQASECSKGTPLAPLMMPSLSLDGSRHSASEIWLTNGAPSYHQRNGIAYSLHDEFMFGSIQLAESDFNDNENKESGHSPLHRAAEAAYREIFALMDELGYPHVLRFWNYLAHINAHTDGLERYRQFNAGRQDGFLQAERHVTGNLVPAASALGSAGGPLTVCFIASKNTAPIPIENPRQVSAYDYPPEYGVRRPTFSRASLVPMREASLFLLSGTASIIGHESVHQGDVVAQTREIIANILAVLDEANRKSGKAAFSLDDLHYKVYVRHPEQLPLIDGELRKMISAPIIYLQADICRSELLLEIEAASLLSPPSVR